MMFRSIEKTYVQFQLHKSHESWPHLLASKQRLKQLITGKFRTAIRYGEPVCITIKYGRQIN